MKCWGLLLPVLCLATPLSAQEGLPPFRVTTLDNGLRVLLAPDPAATTVDVGVWYGAGSRYERAGATGITHLIERLQFRGSQNVPEGEHARRLSQRGGAVNTTLAAEYVCLWQSIPAEALEQALDLEADRMANLRPSARAIDEERRAMTRLGASSARTPLAEGLARLMALTFQGHPYARPVTGNVSDVARLGAREVQAALQERWRPANAMLTIVGRIDEAATLAAIQRRFGGIARGSAPSVARLKLPEAAARRERGVFDTPAPLLVAGWPLPGAADPDLGAFEVIASLLAGPGGGVLAQRLSAANGFGVQAGLEVRRDASLLYATVAAAHVADTLRLESELLAQMRQLAEEDVAGESLDRVKRRLELGTLLGLQTSRGLGDALGRATFLLGDPAAASRRLEGIRRVTPADIRRVAGEYLKEADARLVWLIAPNTSTGGR